MADSVALECQDLGQKLAVNIRVRNFSNLEELQFSLNWDESVLMFDTIGNVFPGMNLTAADFLNYLNTPTGTLDFQADAGGAGWPTIPDDDILFTVFFKFVNSNLTTPIDLVGPFSAMNIVASAVPVFTVNGFFESEQDLLPPTMSACPPSVSINLAANQCELEVPLVLPIATDACSGLASLVSSQFSDTFPAGVTVVTFTATDNVGNTTTCTTTVSLLENIAPQFSSCPTEPIEVTVGAQITLDPNGFLDEAEAVTGCDGVVLEFGLPLASDNCGTPTVSQISGPITGGEFPIGLHTLVFQVQDGSGNSAQCSVEIRVLALPLLELEADTVAACPNELVVLSAELIAGATYTWSGPTGQQFPNSNTIMIPSLDANSAGPYTVIATVNGCNYPTATALALLIEEPDAVDDMDFVVDINGRLDSINVLLNDVFTTGDGGTVLVSPISGLTEIGNGLFSFTAGSTTGRVAFTYTLCSVTCPDLCDVGIVTITVRDKDCITIPNIITPNGDDINDYFEIPCLDTGFYPNNSLVIYNQWGDKVFEESPYSNDPSKAWQGTLEGEPGKDLPDGVYYYIFNPGTNGKPITGFIEIYR
jgi:gliding motility-associated-like protein